MRASCNRGKLLQLLLLVPLLVLLVVLLQRRGARWRRVQRRRCRRRRRCCPERLFPPAQRLPRLATAIRLSAVEADISRSGG